MKNKRLNDWMWGKHKRVSDVARDLGYTYTHVSRVLHGHVPITESFRMRFTLVYGEAEAASVFDSQ